MFEKSSNFSAADPSFLTIKGDLYPKLWDKNTKKLNSAISFKLKAIAQDFVKGFDYPIKIKDIILTGSIANYNWNHYSDVDLHILVDFNDIPDEYLKTFKDYFDAKKQLWNKKHVINIMGHEVEIYIQDVDEPHHSTGVYSVKNDNWVREPVHKDADIDYEAISEKTEDFIDKIDKVSKLFSGNEYEKTIAAIEALQNKLKRYRKAGLEKGGEYSTENLVFKMLRNGGHLENLSNLKQMAYDREMSIEEEIFNFQKTLEEAKKTGDRCTKIAKRKYKVWPSAYASGYLVKCRKKKGRIKEELDEEIELDEGFLEELLESSKYSEILNNLVSKEQELRNKFASMIKKEGGWSKELLNKFIKTYNTTSDDVFDSKGVENELLKIEPSLDYENFSNSDWDNFWLLSQHMDRHPDFQKRSLQIIKKYKGKDSKEYKKLLFRIGSNKGTIKTNQGVTVDLDKIDDMGIDWENVEKELNEKWSEKYKRSIDCSNPKGFSQKAHCQGRKKDEDLELDEEYLLELTQETQLNEKDTFSKEKSQGLHGWFSRQGGKGKSKGWVDCNTCRKDTKTGKKTCKACGRGEGEKRSKYPACRPTPSQCTRSGMKRKKSSKQVSWKSKKEN